MSRFPGFADCECDSELASHGRWIDHDNARPNCRHANEMLDIERQQVRHRMHMADGHKASVMNLLADDCQPTYESLPRRIDVRRLRHERERRLEYPCLRLRIDRRQSQAVHCLGAS